VVDYFFRDGRTGEGFHPEFGCGETALGNGQSRVGCGGTSLTT